MNFKPNGNWVVLPNPATKKTDSGIILDDATVEKLVPAIMNCMDNVGLRTQLGIAFKEIHQTLRRNASETAADSLLELIAA